MGGSGGDGGGEKGVEGSGGGGGGGNRDAVNLPPGESVRSLLS